MVALIDSLYASSNEIDLHKSNVYSKLDYINNVSKRINLYSAELQDLLRIKPDPLYIADLEFINKNETD